MPIYIIIRCTVQEYANDDREILYCGTDKEKARQIYDSLPSYNYGYAGQTARECECWVDGVRDETIENDPLQFG